MNFPFGREVGRLRSRRSRKTSDANRFPIGVDICDEPSAALTDSKNTEFIVTVWSAPILEVNGMADIPKIIESVVARVAVLMVDIQGWPSAVNNQPSKPVCMKRYTIDSDSKIASRITAGHFPDVASMTADAPSENSGFRIVVEQSAGAFCGKIRGSHAASVKGWVVRAPAAFARCRGSSILQRLEI
jgi:hypothetical protein